MSSGFLGWGLPVQSKSTVFSMREAIQAGDIQLEERREQRRLDLPLRQIAVVGLALGVGVIAIVLVKAVRSAPRPAAAAPAARPVVAEGTPVVVAAAEISRGQMLEPKLLKLVSFPAGAAPTGAFADIAQLAMAPPNGRVALRAMVPGEPVLAERVSQPGGRANLSGALTPGLRAIGVKSSEVAGVGGFLLPGDRVDVLATHDSREDRTSYLQVLAQNVRVLGVDQTDDQSETKPHIAEAVTIEVTPDEAQAITLAQTIGEVTLSLRQYGDEAPVKRRALNSKQLGGGGAPSGGVAKAPAASDLAQVRVTRGVETAQYMVGR